MNKLTMFLIVCRLEVEDSDSDNELLLIDIVKSTKDEKKKASKTNNIYLPTKKFKTLLK